MSGQAWHQVWSGDNGDNELAQATVTNTIVAGNRDLNGDPIDIEGGAVDPASAHKLIGDTATSDGLMNGTNGNLVGVNWQTVLENNGTKSPFRKPEIDG